MYEHHASFVITHLTRRFVQEDQAGRRGEAERIKAAIKLVEQEFPEARAELDARYGLMEFKEQS